MPLKYLKCDLIETIRDLDNLISVPWFNFTWIIFTFRYLPQKFSNTEDTPFLYFMGYTG